MLLYLQQVPPGLCVGGLLLQDRLPDLPSLHHLALGKEVICLLEMGGIGIGLHGGGLR